VSRDPKRLRAYQLAHGLVLGVFRHSPKLPPEQRYIITRQLQRAALSVALNLVEGCARHRLSEYRHFVNIALGSARETEYLLSLIEGLHLLDAPALSECRSCCDALVGSLQNLMTALDRME
jgi:four helix bundle protein